MRSQAGHDAYAVATLAPTAMIFTPCFEGISHNVNEAIELTRSVPGARWVTVPGMGHALPRVTWAPIVDAIAEHAVWTD